MRRRKRISPKEVIEASNPEREHGYIKFPGGRIESVDSSEIRSQTTSYCDKEKTRRLWEESGRKRYTDIHTHVRDGKREKNPRYAVPSEPDLRGFLMNDDEKSMVIAQHDKDTRKVAGYFIVRKTKRTPKSGYSFLGNTQQEHREKLHDEEYEKRFSEIVRATRQYEKAYLDKNGNITEALTKIAGKYDLQYKYLPAENYQVNNKKDKFVLRRSLEGKVERALGIISLTGFLFSILFLSGITGNVIGATETKSLIGLISILIGLTTGGIYLYLKKKH